MHSPARARPRRRRRSRSRPLLASTAARCAPEGVLGVPRITSGVVVAAAVAVAVVVVVFVVFVVAVHTFAISSPRKPAASAHSDSVFGATKRRDASHNAAAKILRSFFTLFTSHDVVASRAARYSSQGLDAPATS